MQLSLDDHLTPHACVHMSTYLGAAQAHNMQDQISSDKQSCEQKRKEKTTLLSVIKEKLTVDPSFPLA